MSTLAYLHGDPPITHCSERAAVAISTAFPKRDAHQTGASPRVTRLSILQACHGVLNPVIHPPHALSCDSPESKHRIVHLVSVLALRCVTAGRRRSLTSVFFFCVPLRGRQLPLWRQHEYSCSDGYAPPIRGEFGNENVGFRRTRFGAKTKVLEEKGGHFLCLCAVRDV